MIHGAIDAKKQRTDGAEDMTQTTRHERPIAAIATAPGPAGIAVVRLSGEGAPSIADRLCPGAKIPPSAQEAGTFRLRRLFDPATGEPIDEALVLVFRAPHSYTGEDAVEFQVHGGRAAPRRVLSALFAAGAAPAGPGEFSRRAFLNGRLPLDRAEAVMDLVAAQSDRAARAAAEQLAGALGRRTDAAYDALLALCADVEATLDFGEEESSGLLPLERFAARLDTVRADLAALAATFREGRLLREGALVVLSGPPNAGKSTLFNALLGADRAIVADEPGTTRDSLEEGLVLAGVPIRLADTAGLREGADGVEREGIGRARALAADADLELRLVPPDENPTPNATGPRTLLVFSKCDLPGSPPEAALPPGAVRASARTGEGLDSLRAAILERLGADPAGTGGQGAAVNARHRALLDAALAALGEAEAAYLAHGEEAAAPAAAHLRAAAESLGSITGRTYTDDLLDTVFGRFCVGK